MIACSLGQMDVVDRLIGFSRLCLEEVSVHGKTAVALAREKGHHNIVQLVEREVERRSLIVSALSDNGNIEHKLSQIQL